jgi:carboxyl-terminal processing protease
MFHKGKLIVFWGSALIVLYGITAFFYGRGVAAKDQDAYKQLYVFMEALKKIKEDYVEVPDMNKVQEGALRGLIDALDPYSSFLTKDQLAAIEKRNASGNAGVGLVLSKRADVMYVVSEERNGPAEQAGIRAGDYLVGIDDQTVDDKSIMETTSLLRGAPGSKVKITVFRGSRPKPLDFELARKVDAQAPTNSQMVNGNVGLLDISSLANVNLEQVKVKLKTLISAGAQKLVLDLRDCADGTTADGAALANLFLKSGTIFYSQNKDGQRVQEVTAAPERAITDLPMVVLINGSTAGPAEITAGALKDNKRAQVVGEKTFGIGSSQKQIVLKSGSVLFISTAKFYTPGGQVIEDDETPRNTGIKPDVPSPEEDKLQAMLLQSYYDDQDATNVAKYRELRDKINQIQLEKAIESLNSAQPASGKSTSYMNVSVKWAA